MLLTGFAVITEVRNDPGLDQYAVGFVQQHAEVGHNIAVKLLEQDQALTDLDLKGLYCLQRCSGAMGLTGDSSVASGYT